MACQKKHLDWQAIKNALRLYSIQLTRAGVDHEGHNMHIFVRSHDGQTHWAPPFAGTDEIVRTIIVFSQEPTHEPF